MENKEAIAIIEDMLNESVIMGNVYLNEKSVKMLCLIKKALENGAVLPIEVMNNEKFTATIDYVTEHFNKGE